MSSSADAFLLIFNYSLKTKIIYDTLNRIKFCFRWCFEVDDTLKQWPKKETSKLTF